MFSILFGMAVIILAGVGWRRWLGSSQSDTVRSHLAQAVYHIFLPALVLHVLWHSPVDLNTIRVPVVAAVSVLLSLLAAWLLYRAGGWLFRPLENTPNTMIGALLLASAFGNFSYLGLPILGQLFGNWAQVIAIQFDLLASTPILFSVGVLLARHYGATTEAHIHPLLTLFRVPAIWAAIAGIALSALSIPVPLWLNTALSTLGAAVVPLMLLSVGMALRWQKGWQARIPLLLPALLIQLMLMPWIAWGAATVVGVPTQQLAPVIVEAAMPTMVLGLVICDRFKLDSGLYAEAVTLSTALALITLPLWMQWAS